MSWCAGPCGDTRKPAAARLGATEFGAAGNLADRHNSARVLRSNFHRERAMSSQSDLFNKATECERLMNLEADEDKKPAFKLLREMWIALAN